MISVKNGKVKLKGNAHQLLTEFTGVAMAIRKTVAKDLDDVAAKELLMDAVRVSFMDKNDLEEEIRKTRKDILYSMLNELGADREEEDHE